VPEPANILIGYAMRSGSTLLQHILNEHSLIHAYSDFNSLFVLPPTIAGLRSNVNRVVKPLDLFYVYIRGSFYERFDKFIWIARDPRDSYLSAEEAGPIYQYLFWRPGERKHGIDLGLLERWKRTYHHYFDDETRWHLIKYEELVTRPRRILRRLFAYLELPFEKVYPFRRFRLYRAGGDYKLRNTKDIHSKSVGRYRNCLSADQQSIFRKVLGPQIQRLGYSP
jgi:hypothetical protein